MSWDDPLESSTVIELADIDSTPYNIYPINPIRFYEWYKKSSKVSKWKDCETNHIFIIDSNLNIIEIYGISGYSGWGATLDTTYNLRIAAANESITDERIESHDVLRKLDYCKFKYYHMIIEKTSPVFHTFEEAVVALNFHIKKLLVIENKKISILISNNEKVCNGKFDILCSSHIKDGEVCFNVKLNPSSFRTVHGHDTIPQDTIIGLQEEFSKRINNELETRKKTYEKLKDKLVV